MVSPKRAFAILELFNLRGPTSDESAGPSMGVAFSPDGTRVATGIGRGTIQICDATGGQGLLTLRGHSDAVTSLAFSSRVRA